MHQQLHRKPIEYYRRNRSIALLAICLSVAIGISLRTNAVSHHQSERERQAKNEETDEAELKSKEIIAHDEQQSRPRPSDPARNLLFENNGEGMRIKRRLF